MPQEKQYFPALTGLRAVGALFVFFNHQSWFSHLGKFADRVHSELHIGVSIFFVLSGFLISWHNLELKSEQKFNIRDYLVKRWARIYPLWLTLTVLTFIVQWYTCNWECFSFRYFILNLSLTQAYFADALFTGISQGWSLCIEVVFYVLAILLLKNRKYTFWAIPIGLACATLYLYIGNAFPGLGFLYTLENILLYTFFGRVLEFMAGVYLADQLFNRERSVKSNIWPIYTTIGAVGIVCVPFVLVWFIPNLPSSIYSVNGIILQHVLMSLFVTLLLLGLNTEHSWLSKLLGSTFMEYAGKASFAFYLIHLGVIQQFITLHFPISLEFPLLCLVSLLLYFFIEEPVRKWIISKSSK